MLVNSFHRNLMFWSEQYTSSAVFCFWSAWNIFGSLPFIIVAKRSICWILMNNKTEEDILDTSLGEKSNCDQSDLFMDLWEWTQSKIGSGIRIVKDMGNMLDLRFLSSGSVNQVGFFVFWIWCNYQVSWGVLNPLLVCQFQMSLFDTWRI